ncbi:MAG: hypothetical protein ACRDD8_13705 [Bacteroidales bacterium]
MNQNKTFSAPQAIVYIDNEIAGYMQSVDFSENFTRVRVSGLGDLRAKERPATAVDCTFSASALFISFDSPWFKKMQNRIGTVQEVIDTIGLLASTFQIVVYKKIVTGLDESQKLVTSVDKTGEVMMKATDCVIDTVSWSLSQGGISQKNITGSYNTPMTL